MLDLMKNKWHKAQKARQKRKLYNTIDSITDPRVREEVSHMAGRYN